MKQTDKIKINQYTKVEYTQFKQTKAMQIFRRVLHYLMLPFLLPFIIVSRISKTGFRTCSEIVSLIPFAIGVPAREAFYRYTLKSCGRNVVIGFGTIIFYSDISIGNNVLIGVNCTIHHCNIGNDVLIAEGVRLLSGSRYHSFENTKIPMSQQDGYLKKIQIGNDVWIGSNSVIMESINNGAIIGAGSVVIKEIEAYTIYAGVPAHKIRERIYHQ